METQTSHYDKNKLYLGTICKRQHEWAATGMSLRYKSGGNCQACQMAVNATHKVAQKTPEETERMLERRKKARSQYAKDYYQKKKSKAK